MVKATLSWSDPNTVMPSNVAANKLTLMPYIEKYAEKAQITVKEVTIGVVVVASVAMSLLRRNRGLQYDRGEILVNAGVVVVGGEVVVVLVE